MLPWARSPEYPNSRCLHRPNRRARWCQSWWLPRPNRSRIRRTSPRRSEFHSRADSSRPPWSHEARPVPLSRWSGDSAQGRERRLGPGPDSRWAQVQARGQRWGQEWARGPAQVRERALELAQAPGPHWAQGPAQARVPGWAQVQARDPHSVPAKARVPGWARDPARAWAPALRPGWDRAARGGFRARSR